MSAEHAHLRSEPHPTLIIFMKQLRHASTDEPSSKASVGGFLMCRVIDQGGGAEGDNFVEFSDDLLLPPRLVRELSNES